ncbi:MAG: YfiR family protein [bacterium]|nr:YfiR family protein [bacterium]
MIVMIVVCVVASGTLNTQPAHASLREYKLKAAFLYNFVKFVKWPTAAFADTNTPIVIGVLGEDPFGVALEAIENKTIGGRQLVIKRYKGLQDLEPSHILFISSSERARLPQILVNLKGASVLTVGEMVQFAQSGGIINFTRRKNKIRLEINLDAAKRAGLKISSQLLKLAKVIKA